jgi:methanethiol S-methyltransferase
MVTSTENHIAKGIAYTALVLGTVSLAGFGLFLFAGPFSPFDFELGFYGLLLTNTGLSLVFFLQHSILLRKWFRDRVLEYIPKPYFGSFFAISSALALLLMLIAWQESSCIVFSAQGACRLIFRIIFLVSTGGFLWASRSLESFDSFGTRTLLLHAKNRPPGTMPMTIRGTYKFVRHPLYFFSLLMIWSNPDISADRLLFNVIWSAWIVTGTFLEERDLVRDFGKNYQEYQKAVPMLIPWKIPYKRQG